MDKNNKTTVWPILNYGDLKNTIQTVQLWSQIVGKIRLRKTPWINHGWHVALYVSSRGLTTGPIPYENGSFQIDFDFIAHRLLINTSNGGAKQMLLGPKTVASFYNEVFALLKELGIEVDIYARPSEIADGIPFAEDEIHKTYNTDQMHAYWQALVRIDAVLTRFRAGFNGKCSPNQLFWGEFDFSVSLFSGRPAPLHHGTVPNMPERIMQESYSHEVASGGFWAGSEHCPFPAFYAYSYPAGQDYGKQSVQPEQAVYNDKMGEYLLKYEHVQQADDPAATLLLFFNSTFEAAKTTGNWDPALSCDLTGFEK